jgi:hypothetical protein
MPDVNWFFSSCAQTAGAIVAIIGGFLVTRLVSIGAERKGILRSRASATQRLDHARQRESEAEQDLRKLEAHEYRASVRYRIVSGDRQYTADALLQRYTGTFLSEPDLMRIQDEVREVAERARVAFGNLGDNQIADLEFDVAAARLATPPSVQDRDVFTLVFVELRRAARHRLQENRRLGFIPRPDWIETTTVSLPESIAQGNERSLVFQRYAEAKLELDRARSELEAYGVQADSLDDWATLIPAWLLLFYISAVGVGLPLALLPAGECATRWRVPVLVLFLAGLAALLVYFFVLGMRGWWQRKH